MQIVFVYFITEKSVAFPLLIKFVIKSKLLGNLLKIYAIIYKKIIGEFI